MQRDPQARPGGPVFSELSEEAQIETIEAIRHTLFAERARIQRRAMRTLTEELTLDPGDLPDEVDMAVADRSQEVAFRLRGRERRLVSKIGLALERLADGEYFECTDCGEEIGLNRLKARPVTTQCIQCKTAEERQLRGVG